MIIHDGGQQSNLNHWHYVTRVVIRSNVYYYVVQDWLVIRSEEDTSEM